MMQIWGRINSTNVRKVLWCAEEIGLSYERLDAGGQFGVVNDPEYRSKNPNGLVPCLTDGDLVLWGPTSSSATWRASMAPPLSRPSPMPVSGRRVRNGWTGRRCPSPAPSGTCSGIS